MLLYSHATLPVRTDLGFSSQKLAGSTLLGRLLCRAFICRCLCRLTFVVSQPGMVERQAGGTSLHMTLSTRHERAALKINESAALAVTVSTLYVFWQRLQRLPFQIIIVSCEDFGRAEFLDGIEVENYLAAKMRTSDGFQRLLLGLGRNGIL